MVSDLHEYIGVLGLCSFLKMFVFGVNFVNKDAESYDWRHPHKIQSQQERRKMSKHLEDLFDQ